jgi:hypothetical protein
MKDIDVMTGGAWWDGTNTDEYVDRLGHLAGTGITWTMAPFERTSFAGALDSLRAWGEIRSKL